VKVILNLKGVMIVIAITKRVIIMTERLSINYENSQ